MAGALLFIGIIWLVYHLVEEASWNTNAYDGKEYDVTLSLANRPTTKYVGSKKAKVLYLKLIGLI